MRGSISPDAGSAAKWRYQIPPVALVCLLLALSPLCAATQSSASLDRSAIALGETVQLKIETDGTPASGPDLSVLAADFQIVDRRTSHRISVIDGQRSELSTLVLRLLPRRAGEFGIPSIPIGDAATQPLRLSVAERASGAAEPTAGPAAPTKPDKPPPTATAFLEAVVEPAKVHVGQQLLLTAKVFMDGSIQRQRLRDPQVPDAEILPLGEDRYRAQHDGRSHQVYERRYALFPREAGQLQIAPLVFEGWASETGGGTSAFGFRAAGQPVLAQSGNLTAQVLPAPEGADPGRWLPARSLALSESGPETYQVRVGEPIERRINLRAEGVMARNLPALAVQAPYQLSRRKQQPRLWDERQPEGVIGVRQEIVTLTAQEPGHYRLPPLRLDWWRTETESWETAILPARDLVVLAGRAADTGAPATAEPSRYRAPADLETTTADAPPVPAGTELADRSGTNRLWIWITVALGLAWLVTMAAWWRSKPRKGATGPAPSMPEPPAATDEADPLQKEIDAVRAAYELGNAGAAREALLAWAGHALPEQPPSNLARLAQRCPEPLRSQVLLLEEAFFSPEPVAWDRHPVWDQLRSFVSVPLEEPASFRRGKPIRRRAPNPDVE